MTTNFSCFVVGEGSLALSCLEILLDQGGDLQGIYSADRSIQAWAVAHNIIQTDNQSSFENQIFNNEYDYLFSINNLDWVLPAAVINRAQTATINYHNAPLTQPSGLSTTIWTLFSCETQHAVTVHEVIRTSDARRILQQKIERTIFGHDVRIGDILPVRDRTLIPMISQQNAVIFQQVQTAASTKLASVDLPALSTVELAPFQHPYLLTSYTHTDLHRQSITFDRPVPIVAETLAVIFAAYCARLSPEPEFDLGLQIDGRDQRPLHIHVQADESFDQFQSRLASELELATHLKSCDQAHFLPVAIAIAANPQFSYQPSAAAMTFVAYADGSLPELIHTGALTPVDQAAIVHQLQILISACGADPAQQLARLPLISVAEQQQLLIDWNQTSTSIPINACIHHLFEQQVGLTPTAIAVAFKSKQLTYQELNARANQLAHYLIGQGVQPDSFVGLQMERSIEMVIGLLAIHKAGGAYLPLDPDFPADRLTLMIEDSQSPIILTQQRLTTKLTTESAAQVISIDTIWSEIVQYPTTNPQAEVNPTNLAYIIYTSGSTGKPKGVMVEHRNAVNFFTGMDARIGNSPGVWLAVTSLSFDISVLELFWTLTRGFKIVIYNAKTERTDLTQDHSIAGLIDQHQVTHLQCTPSMAGLLLADPKTANALSQLQTMMVGGEALTEALALQLQQVVQGQIHNMYGPTETTIWSTTYALKSVDGVVPLGRPIANTQLYILDRLQQPVPVGIAGELLIGGNGVTRGYLNRPDLTQERFIPNPFSGNPLIGVAFPSGNRLYRTGDLVRYRADGNLEFLGRIDFQVKIRGYRIELGEIETILGRHETIREVAIVVREDVPGDQRIVAYFIPQPGQQPVIAVLRDYLRDQLPEYMVPSNFVELQSFPLTPNRKVDRKAFPAPFTAQSQQLGSKPTSPTSKPSQPIITSKNTEQDLTKIWQKVLQIPVVAITDNFFNLGGNSLMAVTLMSEIRLGFNVDLPLISLFQSPTISDLAKEIEQVQS